MLLAYTLSESRERWCRKQPQNSVHSFKHFSDLIEYVFYHFHLEALVKKILKQQKAPHELLMDFWKDFHLIMFEALKIQMKF